MPDATINADGAVTQLEYYSDGDLELSSTPDGNSGGQLATTGYTYDGDGNQISVKDARGFTTNTAFNADDDATLIADQDLNARLICYDGDENVTQAVPPAGVAANGLTAASCPATYPSGYGTRLASDATVTTYNADGQSTQETTPAPAGQSGYETATYTYDGSGNRLTVTAPPAVTGGPSQVTADTYNAAGQLASETTGYRTSAASTVSYCYDPNGNGTSVVYAAAHLRHGPVLGFLAVDGYRLPQAGYQTTYSYDSAGELVSTTTPATSAAQSGAATASTYDPAGNKLTSTGLQRDHHHLDLHAARPCSGRVVLGLVSALGHLQL